MHRFTISLDAQLARQFDQLIADRRHGSRSEAVRDLIRHGLTRAGLGLPAEAWTDPTSAASLSFVHDPRDAALQSRLRACRDMFQALLLSSLQTRLGDGEAMEVWMLKGHQSAIHACEQSLVRLPGVAHVQSNLVALGGTSRPAEVPTIPAFRVDVQEV